MVTRARFVAGWIPSRDEDVLGTPGVPLPKR
jgi:hypothetical protein